MGNMIDRKTIEESIARAYNFCIVNRFKWLIMCYSNINDNGMILPIFFSRDCDKNSAIDELKSNNIIYISIKIIGRSLLNYTIKVTTDYFARMGITEYDYLNIKRINYNSAKLKLIDEYKFCLEHGIRYLLVSYLILDGQGYCLDCEQIISKNKLYSTYNRMKNNSGLCIIVKINSISLLNIDVRVALKQLGVGGILESGWERSIRGDY